MKANDKNFLLTLVHNLLSAIIIDLLSPQISFVALDLPFQPIFLGVYQQLRHEHNKEWLLPRRQGSRTASSYRRAKCEKKYECTLAQGRFSLEQQCV